jgi:GT2 family glycosyltransferase
MQVNLHMDVSVVIVNWNTRNILRDCLRSVFDQTQDIMFEVIVVDNASSDGSTTMVKSEFSQVILIENKKNRGFAAANNQGILISRGRYCLLLNSDTIVLEGAVQKTLRFADCHPQAAVVGCCVLNKDLTLQPTGFMFPSILNLLLSMTFLSKIFPHSRFFGREQMGWWKRDDIRPVEVITGCFMFVRREAIDQVGSMDEVFFMYAEEADWCRRFRDGGWTNLFMPGAEIIHLGGQSTKQIRPQMTLQLRAGVLQFIRKHDGVIHYYLACFLTSLWFTLRIPYWILMSIVDASNRRGRFEMAQTYCSGAIRSLGGYHALRFKI